MDDPIRQIDRVVLFGSECPHTARPTQHRRPFDKFLADEQVFSCVIPNRDRINYTTGIVLSDM